MKLHKTKACISCNYYSLETIVDKNGDAIKNYCFMHDKAIGGVNSMFMYLTWCDDHITVDEIGNKSMDQKN